MPLQKERTPLQIPHMQTKVAANNSQPLQHTAQIFAKRNSIRGEMLLASTGSIGAIADHRSDAIK